MSKKFFLLLIAGLLFSLLAGPGITGTGEVEAWGTGGGNNALEDVPPGGYPFAPLQASWEIMLEVVGDSSQVRLSWQGYAGADNYKIYRRDYVENNGNGDNGDNGGNGGNGDNGGNGGNGDNGDNGGNGDNNDDCFIATAAFGSRGDAPVILLRQFRDAVLAKHGAGRFLVDQYYRYSPAVAASLEGRETLRAMTRIALLPALALAYGSLHPSLSLLVLLLAGLLSLIAMRRARGSGLRSAGLLLVVFLSGLVLPAAGVLQSQGNFTPGSLPEGYAEVGTIQAGTGDTYTDETVEPNREYQYLVAAAQGEEIIAYSQTQAVRVPFKPVVIGEVNLLGTEGYLIVDMTSIDLGYYLYLKREPIRNRLVQLGEPGELADKATLILVRLGTKVWEARTNPRPDIEWNFIAEIPPDEVNNNKDNIKSARLIVTE